MIRENLTGLTFAFLLILIAVSTASAYTAGISVPETWLAERTFSITANALKPPECATIDLASIVIGPNAKGTGANDLILGTPGDDNLGGGGGSDCVIGGGGNDKLNGGKGNGDVCIGGPGTDTFKGCDTEIQ